MAVDRKRKELLLKTLKDLGEDDFEIFKFYTSLSRKVCDNASRENIADELLRKHGENTLDVTIKILEKIGNNNLAEMLRRNMQEITGTTPLAAAGSAALSPDPLYDPASSLLPIEGGAVFSVHDDDQIARLKGDLQDDLRSLYSIVPEGREQQPLADINTEINVTYGDDVGPDKRHEVLHMETCGAAKKSILPCDIFKSTDGKPIRTLLTVGFAGIGKTFLVQKFVLDWASRNTNHDVHFIFPFTFRELNMDSGKSFTLAKLIGLYVCKSRRMSEETLNNIFADLQTSENRNYESSGIKILFILDGLDESILKMDLKNETKVDIDVKKPYPLEVLLAHLVKGNLLPCARVWITTRPAAVHDIPSELIDSQTEVRGFSDSQRLKYFNTRFPNKERITEHIKKSRTIFIMCHMPIFCWMAATVLQDYLDKGKEVELPTTLTDMYGGYVSRHMDESDKRLTSEYIHYLKALAKLAFHHTMNKCQIFYEKELVDSGFDWERAAKHCSLVTEVFKEVPPLRRNQQCKMFQFIHLTVQEFLAALYVMMSLFHDNKNVLDDSGLAPKGVSIPITQVHWSALQKACESEGNLDLFLRFLFGLSFQCNQELVEELLKAPKDSRQSNSDTVKLIKERIKQNTPEKNINLFYCLNELKDDSLLEQIQQYLRSGHVSWNKMPTEMWSALAFFLMCDKETINSFNLRKYSASALGLEMLLSVVKASQKSLLFGCKLDKNSCPLLASVLSSPSNLKHLDLKNNNLSDEGVEFLSKGLASPHCILNVLSLEYCRITARGCISLAKALKFNPYYLQELNLRDNDLLDEGVQILSKGLASPGCILKVLRLSRCKITEQGCVSLAETLKLNPSHLQELHLTGNYLSDKGVEILSEGLASPECILKVLDLSKCKITKKGCVSLAEALQVKSSHLQELHLSTNYLSDEGFEILSKGLASPHCILKVLKLSKCKITKKGCVSLAEALKLNRSRLQILDLSYNDLSDEGTESLSEGLSSLHCNLKVLDLSKCNITKKGCVSLVEALRFNPSLLRNLVLWGNDLGEEGKRLLTVVKRDYSSSMDSVGINFQEQRLIPCIKIGMRRTSFP
ncbi:NACHT, LRR and PYD domains-containing protein 12-like [Corythoichthys intestinalis]|uniref:NACHT, LRR and PYD domains-containing protein 12-like n=1 Tax=Corythoichthys intestinalis TaxID=161448 RepID=UPI0025A5E6F1|nr:NACHT, LRR and PYD domains-containing protein 12-like [Corythoichthys intestinalis]XP_057678108.1 NACHT, LRR and PYD domains-containing protein 12-like [Corythoichthys intestinalis]